MEAGEGISGDRYRFRQSEPLSRHRWEWQGAECEQCLSRGMDRIRHLRFYFFHHLLVFVSGLLIAADASRIG